MRKNCEALYMTQTDHDYYLDQWEKMRSQSEIMEGPEIVPITYSNDNTFGLVTDCLGLTKKTCGLAVTDEQRSLIVDMILDTGITGSTRIAGAIERNNTCIDLPLTIICGFDVFFDCAGRGLPGDFQKQLMGRFLE